MRIDLHVHTSEHSACARDKAAEMVRAARDAGMDAVVITDHNHHLTAGQQRRLERQVAGIRVFRGSEINVFGNGLAEDVLIIGSQSCRRFRRVPIGELWGLADFISQSGALSVLAHPFRYHDELAIDFDQFTPHAVEVASLSIDPATRPRIEELAREHGIRAVCTSDAHIIEGLGSYCIELHHDVETEQELAAAVRAGEFRMCALEADRIPELGGTS